MQTKNHKIEQTLQIYSHRGMSKQAPENTLAAYKLAIDAGFGIEVDLQITLDGHLVCFHDWCLGRKTLGAGMVWNYTLSELKTLDAGEWFSPEFKGERIPTLEEVLELTKDEVQIALEMKCPGIEKQLIQLLKKKDAFKKIFVFDIPQDVYFPFRMKATCPEIRVGRNCISKHDLEILLKNGFKNIDVIMAITHTPWLTPELVKIAHNHSVLVIDTKVNDSHKMKYCLELGLDGICSDYPEQMRVVV